MNVVLKRDNFVKHTIVTIKKINKKDNKIFTALFLLQIGKPSIAQVSLPQLSILFSNVPTLKLRLLFVC